MTAQTDDRHMIELGRALLAGRFDYFLRYAFERIQQSRSLSDAVYLEAFAFELERCARGQNRRLVVNMPPRHLKSFALVALQAWILGREPDREILMVTYGEELSRSHTNLFRRIVRSGWYRDVFRGMRLAEGGDRLFEVRTTRGGVRRAFSIGGAGTGLGGDIIMCDDLAKAQDVNSPAMRENLERYVDEVLLTRFNDPAEGVLISAQQRLRVDDIVQRLAQLPNVTVMSLPAIADRTEQFQLYDGRTWSREPGDLLDPERMPLTELDAIRTRTPMVFAAQYQQNPSTTASFMIDLSQVRFVSEPPADPLVSIQFWDTAIAVNDDSDWSVGANWAWKDGVWHLIDLVRRKWSFPVLKREVVAFRDRHGAREVYVEAAASGVPLIQQLRSDGHNAFRYFPVNGAKDVRFAAVTPFLQSAEVAILDRQPWTDELRRELAAFPSGRHDDIVDTVTMFAEFANGPAGRALIATAQNNWVRVRPSSPRRSSGHRRY